MLFSMDVEIESWVQLPAYADDIQVVGSATYDVSDESFDLIEVDVCLYEDGAFVGRHKESQGDIFNAIKISLAKSVYVADKVNEYRGLGV